jgi:hypothetical protein
MEGQVFWIKYLNNRPTSVSSTEILHVTKRDALIQNIDDLMKTFKIVISPEMDSIPISKLNMYLPVGFTRKDLNNHDAFVTDNENDTALRPGFPLVSLGLIGSEYKKPLLIKVTTEGK